jgi:DNA-binding LacI/PurR family transcriptional regulator
MGRTVKLADVARAAGVSQGTVSNVFNRPDLVSEALRERVEEAARNLGYRGPDPRGRLLRAGRVNAIGVVASVPLAEFFTDPYLRSFLSGISRACQSRGAGLSLVSALDDEVAAWNIRTALVDGFILSCIAEGSRLVELARRRGLPFVAVDFPTRPDVDIVKIDDFAGARLGARHLIGLGHRHIAVITYPTEIDDYVGYIDDRRAARSRYEVSRRRLSSYREAFVEAGLEDQPMFETLADAETVDIAVGRILADHPETTAFLCASDLVAIHVCECLEKRGAVIPRDFSVVGFDGTEEAANLCVPLTTVRQPTVEKGIAAVDLILGRDATREAGRVVELPLTLVPGGSAAAPRQGPWPAA